MATYEKQKRRAVKPSYLYWIYMIILTQKQVAQMSVTLFCRIPLSELVRAQEAQASQNSGVVTHVAFQT